jgi:hypothetical protein
MKFCVLVASATLFISSTTSYGAIIGVINGNGADGVIRGPSPGPTQDANGIDVVTTTGYTLRVGSNGSDNANKGRAAVYVFQLPDLGAIADPFTSASLSFGLKSIVSGSSREADLYGLGRRAAVGVAATDYYIGDDADTTDATLIQQDIMTPSSTEDSIISTDSGGSDNLLAYLNTQYANGAGVGEYVFLRLNPDGGVNTVQGYDVYTADEPVEARRPTISFTAIPEPSSMALLALSGLALAWRRRRS